MDPAGSGAPTTLQPPAKVSGGSGSGGGAEEEEGGARPAIGLGDPRVGTSGFSDQVQGCSQSCSKNDAPQFITEGAAECEDRVVLLPLAGALLQSEAASLTIGCPSNSVPVENLHDPHPLACGEENTRTHLQPKPDVCLVLDLNMVDSSAVQELNPFFPYKKLGQSKVSDPSESGSTTGATGKSVSHRKWRERKQNGFISSPQGTVAVPKPRGRPPKRKRDDELKRSISTQNELNKYSKVAAPSGLLSGLNPGIINHVRNSKQVYSIIKAIVHSDELENGSQPVFASETSESWRGVSEQAQDQNYGDNNIVFHHGLPTTCKFLPEDGDNVKLQLSSTVTMASDRTCSTSADDLESKHDYMTVLSVKAATVASQWLELLQQDIRGRLAALKRSRKRVRNALQIELPYLISTEFSSCQENESSIAHSSEAGSTGKTVSEAHMTRWRSLFVQMDETLQEEGRHLENRLKEVQGMLSNCDKGLKQATCEATLLGPMTELWKLKNPEISESEWAVQAAAASIYSTCNLAMKTENVSCF